MIKPTKYEAIKQAIQITAVQLSLLTHIAEQMGMSQAEIMAIYSDSAKGGKDEKVQ